MRRLLIATALLLAAPLVAAQAYKWTDAKGTVHYSDAPPPQGTKFNKITTSGSVQALAQPSTHAEGSNATQPQQQAQQPSQPPAPVQDTPENRAKLCASLKSNLEVLRGSGPVVVQDGSQQKVLDAEQRQQQQASAEAQMQQYCSGS